MIEKKGLLEHKQPPFNLMERGGTGVKKKNERRKRGYGVAARLIAFIVSLVFFDSRHRPGMGCRDRNCCFG